MNLRSMIAYSSGKEPSELVFKNINVVNVFTGEIYPADIAVNDGVIVGIGSYEGLIEKNMTGKYAVPGLMDGHIHIESSMVSPFQLNKALLPLGTTTIIADPHEIANVCGITGIEYMIEASMSIPLDIFLMAPSCVPATPSEMAGGIISTHDIETLLKNNHVLGLGEIMNFPGVLSGETDIWDKIDLANKYDIVIDGHAPGVVGNDLNTYVMAGIKSDHECTTLEEAMQRIRLGQWVMIREGTASKNLDDLFPIISLSKSRRLLLVTDDKHPEELTEKGHMDYSIRRLIEKGTNPVTAIQMATINTAEYFRLHDRGAIAPGYIADILVLDDLEKFVIHEVYKRGKLVANHQGIIMTGSEINDASVRKSFFMPELTPDKLALKVKGSKVRVIGVVPNQIITRELIFDIQTNDEEIGGDVEQDVIKIVVAERHNNTGKVGVALVHGFGLKEGAIASSIGHDSHNLTIIGTNDDDICMAGNTIRKLQGGICIVRGGIVLEALSLPIAGLMTSEDLYFVNDKLKKMKEIAVTMGVYSHIDPFMTLAFMTLPVIPELKLTPKGLVDVETQTLVEISI